jgi:hypothetical protein
MGIWMTSKLDALLKTYEGVDKVSVIHSAFGEDPHVVAFVECPKTMSVTDKLEFAFMKTNSIDDAWYNNPEVTRMFDGKSCRSTSVGDMLLLGTDKYKCDSMGWSKV